MFREHFHVGSEFKVVFYDQTDKRKRTVTVGSSREERNPLVAWDRDVDGDDIEMMGFGGSAGAVQGTNYMLMDDESLSD